jgi:HK97 family phage prohead protease
MPASGSTDLPLGARDEKWDSGEAVKSLHVPDDLKKAYFWRDPNGDPDTKSAYKLPFAERDNDGGPGVAEFHAVWKGVTAAAAALQGSQGGVDLPQADRDAVKSKIEAYYKKAAKQYNDDNIEVPWATKHQAARGDQRVLTGTSTDLRVAGQDVSGDGSFIVSGYAAVYEQETTLYSSPMMTEREIISRGAFTNCLQSEPLVHLNIGHDMKQVMASTAVGSGPGSLTLREDPNGLYFEARVSPNVSYARDAAELMKLGVIDQASFAFTIDQQEMDQNQTDDDGTPNVRWRINKVRNLYDVCVTPQGAYPQTSSAVRSLWGAAFGHSEASEGYPGRSQAREGLIQVAEESQGSVVTDDHAAERARARARAKSRLTQKDYQ